MPQKAATIWEDGPGASPTHPDKKLIRDWGTWIEQIIGSLGSNVGSVFLTKTSLLADLAHDPNDMAWVVSDPIVGNNGVYQKTGASGSGFWNRVADLPYSFIVATDSGEGTPDAIKATSPIPVSESAILALNVYEPNTDSVVTVSFNDGPELRVKTNSGNDPVPGGLVGNLLGRISGSLFRLYSDQASAAIVAAAEAAAQQASDYADFIRNSWAVNGPFYGTGSIHDYPLTINPGSVNNLFVNVGGVGQLITLGAYELVYTGGDPFIRIDVPDGVPFEVRIGNKVDVLSPSAGSTGTSALQDKAVTLSKIQDLNASRLLGRKAGPGAPQEITAAELRDQFLPAGAIVDSVYAEYTANTSMSAIIPVDDTIPQIGEGTQILSAAITPKSATNKLRIRFQGQVSASPGPVGVTVAIFDGAANAIAAKYVVATNTDTAYALSLEVDYVPGVVTPKTISARVGPSGGTTNVSLNGSVSTGRAFGGASRATLTIEEIKG